MIIPITLIIFIMEYIKVINKLSTKLITDGNTFKQDYTYDLIKYYLDSPDDKSIRLESGNIYEVVVTDASFVTIQGFINDELISSKTYKDNEELLKRQI